MLKKLLHHKEFTYSITAAAMVMMFALTATKITGFIRQALYSQKFYGADLDIFYAANLLPEVIFNIIVFGSINAVLIPVMTKAIAKEGNQKASYIFSSIVNAGLIILVVISIIIMLFTRNIVELGQSFQIIDPAKFSQAQVEQIITMMRLLLISPVLFGIGSIISSILYIKRHFLVTQLAPLVYNLSGILALFVFAPFWGIYGLAVGVVLGSFLFLMIQIPVFKTTEIKYHANAFDLKNRYTRNAGTLMAPRLFGLAGDQMVLVVQTIIALVYPYGALSAFRNALILRDVPISIFGNTLAQAAFPTLSASATDEDMTSFKKYFLRTFQQIVFLTLPFMVFILVLKLPIVRLAFGIGNGLVKWDATTLTAFILFFMTFAILSLSLVGLITRAFYSLSNTITPLIVSIFCVIIEIFLAITLSNIFSYIPDTHITGIFDVLKNYPLSEIAFKASPSGPAAVGGIALATAIASTIQVIVLLILLSRKIRLFKKDFFLPLGKKIISTFLLGISSYLTLRVLENLVNTNQVINVFLVLAASTIVGFGVYIYSEYTLKDDEFDLILKFYRRLKGVIMRNKKILDQVSKSFAISQQKR